MTIKKINKNICVYSTDIYLHILKDFDLGSNLGHLKYHATLPTKPTSHPIYLPTILKNLTLFLKHNEFSVYNVQYIVFVIDVLS